MGEEESPKRIVVMRPAGASAFTESAQSLRITPFILTCSIIKKQAIEIKFKCEFYNKWWNFIFYHMGIFLSVTGDFLLHCINLQRP